MTPSSGKAGSKDKPTKDKPGREMGKAGRGNTQGGETRASGGRRGSGTSGTGKKERPGSPKSGGSSRPESNRYKEISRAGKGHGFTPTSTTGGKHNPGSLHSKGRAVDFSVKGKSKEQVNKFIRDMKQKGYKVRDERKQPKGQKVWGGPHIHVSSPAPKSKTDGGSKGKGSNKPGRKSESGRAR